MSFADGSREQALEQNKLRFFLRSSFIGALVACAVMSCTLYFYKVPTVTRAKRPNLAAEMRYEAEEVLNQAIEKACLDSVSQIKDEAAAANRSTSILLTSSTVSGVWKCLSEYGFAVSSNGGSKILVSW